MVEEVFKKGKKQREFAKKFDEKIAQKQGTNSKRDKYKQLKKLKKSDGVSRDQVAELDKKFDSVRSKF